MNKETNKELEMEVECFFQSRDKFLKGLSDKNIYGNKCEKHNVYYGKDVEECPICKIEASTEKHRAEIRSKGLFIGRSTREHLIKKNREGVKKYGEYVKDKIKNDNEFKVSWRKRSLEFARKKRLKKLEHSIC